MKPPPRKRNKRNPSPPPAPRKVSGLWQRPEQKKLLKALEELGKTNNVNEDIDCEFLRKHVRTRSISEPGDLLCHLRTEEEDAGGEGQEAHRGVDTHGSLVVEPEEETVSDAFSQMLTVCSTEPNTLRYSNHPQVYRPPTEQDRPVGCTVPLRPVRRLPVKEVQHQHSPSNHSTEESSSSHEPRTPSPAPSSGASSPSTPVRQFHAKFGRTSKFAPQHTPRVVGVQSLVDFERIYHYLSVINSPGESCTLTAMESAIVLDLLMSLPEELPLLDCSKLKKHLLQVYRFLSSTADSKMAREMLKELKGGLCIQTDGTRTNGEQNAAGSADSSDVTDSGEKRLQPEEAESQSSGSNNATGQSGELDLTGLCPPLKHIYGASETLTAQIDSLKCVFFNTWY
ncbi:hypothetical protein F7725_004160 [Dissostichus mawsoni]|uniref:snRNA-activating protein complex subunit 2 n=1 Tax=Dissostichus mawsoni TaxID=36200 RepID=A0A7J5XJB8_DISMA|nr:hypothetical protein F7725_004160 [Dissostichus mawsoni]